MAYHAQASTVRALRAMHGRFAAIAKAFAPTVPHPHTKGANRRPRKLGMMSALRFGVTLLRELERLMLPRIKNMLDHLGELLSDSHRL